jgi:protein SCO1/2
MKPHVTRILLILSAFTAGLVLCFAVILLVAGRGTAPTVPTAAAIGAPFQLTDQDGRTVSTQDLKGRPFLVFFGFTNCPDFCPTTLFDISEMLRALGPDADRVNALFVTVDPERDTPEKLKDYLASFDPHLTGLTGSPEAIAAVAKAYRAPVRKVVQADGYTMDHTTVVYLMDKEGRFVAPFNLKRKPAEAAADLRKYL